MAATPLLERSSRERIIESGPHVFRACRVSASTTDFSVGEPPAVGEGEASPYTMTVHIFFSRTYELRRMAGPLPAPLDEDDITTTPCEEACRRLGGLHFDLTLRVDHRLIVNLPALQDSWVLVAPEDGHCSICMLGLSQRTTVRLRGCKHPFHRKCIFSWFVTNASCPICRDKVLTHLIFDL
ncbi:hypothetical protein QYE76_012502 [Lolium multiflorum]|uniref:RING-type domain-containing protein n=1 Tax=Lolium multiflorum TaxID=4521 RepID=A0AAD8U177_LOLMU|nr:hypothetical protein QYE76_012502 [Lolium multiflorum]